MIILVIKDRAGNKSTLKFKSFNKAAEHARRVIVPQVAEELETLALNAVEEGLGQQDPAAWKRTVLALGEILRGLYYPADEVRILDAVDDWMLLAEDGVGDTWIDWVQP